MTFRSLVLSGLLVVAGGGGVVAQQAATPRGTGSKDLVTTLRNAGNFVMFLQAVEGAGMTQQLRTGTQFTVFAPTDDAFGRIPGDQRDSLLRNKAALAALIQNHVIEGRVTADDVRTGARGMSFMGGGGVKVETGGTYVRVNGAQVIRPNIMASNGIIHVVDQVWLPDVRVRVRGTNPVDSAERAPNPPQ